MILDQLALPLVQAPMAGGPSTPMLAEAVTRAGGFGFLAAGYRSAADLAEDIEDLAARTGGRRFGVNVFVPGPAGDPAAIASYARELADEAARLGVELGRPIHDDDGYRDKLDLLIARPVAAVSFTFGAPSAEDVEALHAAGSEAWVTVTSPAEADAAVAADADVLIAQGWEAGGHRASFQDGPDPVDEPGAPSATERPSTGIESTNQPGDAEGYSLLALLQLLRARTNRPLIATGGIATGAGIAAVLCAGATAAQLGTALLRCEEAGTARVHRELVGSARPTRPTRAFSGRTARGILNRFMVEHSGAPSGYPEVHHLTAPVRAAARRDGDAESVNLWAGQAHELTRDGTVAELFAGLANELRTALARVRDTALG